MFFPNSFKSPQRVWAVCIKPAILVTIWSFDLSLCSQIMVVKFTARSVLNLAARPLVSTEAFFWYFWPGNAPGLCFFSFVFWLKVADVQGRRCCVSVCQYHQGLIKGLCPSRDDVCRAMTRWSVVFIRLSRALLNATIAGNASCSDKCVQSSLERSGCGTTVGLVGTEGSGPS